MSSPSVHARFSICPVRRLAAAWVLAALHVPASAAAQAALECAWHPDTASEVGTLWLRAAGLPPGARADVIVTRDLPGAGATLRWRGRATLQADSSGTVKLPLIPPDTAAVPHPLLWQLAPEAMAPTDPPPLPRQAVHWRLLTPEGERHCTTQLDLPLEAVSESLAPEFPGAFIALPPGRPQPPVVIVLGGSEGGDSMARDYAPRLLRLGLAVVGFPYYNPAGASRPDLAGLPTAFAEIPVDRLDRLATRLRASGRVNMSRVAVLGGSKGAEFALLAASRMPWVRATAAIVPSDVVWEGWGRAGPPVASFAWQGAGFDFMPYEGMASEIGGYATGAEVRLLRPHVAGRARNPERAQAASIPVESIAGALLVAGSMDDQLWPSGAMALSIAERRARFGLQTQVLVFPSAGHGLFGDGSELTSAMDRGPSKVGGTPAANAAAKLATWRALRRFLLDAIGEPRAGAGPQGPGAR